MACLAFIHSMAGSGLIPYAKKASLNQITKTSYLKQYRLISQHF
jgi:hypothetical protein